MAKQLTQANFEQEVLQASGPVVVDFWATWCGPCQRQGPVIEQMAADGMNVGKVDVDANLELAQRYRIMSIPTILVFRDGKETARLVGLHSRAQIEEAMHKA